MSSIINKIKDAVHSDKSDTHNTHNTHTTGTHTTGTHSEGATGPHNSRVANAADPRVDSDRDGSSTVGGAGRTAGMTGSHNTGAFGSNTHGTAEGVHGPHSSHLANAADPRVDSDRDGSSTMGGAGRTAGMTGSHNTGAFGSTNRGTAEGAHGPHSSRLANVADPRVDSDRDGSSTIGGAGRTAGMTGSHGLGTSGTTGGFGNSHGTAEGTHGPHSSRLANVADPRVDSDRDGSSTVGGAGRTSGMTGSHNTGAFGSSNRGTAEGAHGPHSSRLANAADPRVDSDRDGSNTMGNTGRTTGTHGIGSTGHSTGHTGAFGSGPGPASNTAGPHNSDMMNKVDPRVDSDLDGSKTVGGNKTYQ